MTVYMFKTRIKKLLKYTLIACVWLGLWYVAAFATGEELLLPTPHAVLVRLVGMLGTAEFYTTVGTSLLRVIIGMLAGVILGAAGGALSTVCQAAKDFFSPLLTLIKSTPVASFIILLVLWVSRDVAPVIICALIVLPIVWTAVETGLSQTDKSLIEMSDAYKLSHGQKIRLVYAPSVRPYFISALRSSLGMAWKAGIAAEVLLQPIISIGKQIFEAKYTLVTVDLFAWTAAVVIFSVIIEKLALFALAHLGGTCGETRGDKV